MLIYKRGRGPDVSLMCTLSDEQFRAWACDLIRTADGVAEVAYADLYEKTYGTLFRLARYMVRDPHVAEDVLQEVYTKLWQVRSTIDPTRSLKAFIYQMVRNQALNHKRREKLRTLHVVRSPLLIGDAVSPENVERHIEREELGKRIAHCIGQLPERRREAFVLSRYHGLSHEQIAGVMKLTPRTVNNHIGLALQNLRACLEEDGT